MTYNFWMIEHFVLSLHLNGCPLTPVYQANVHLYFNWHMLFCSIRPSCTCSKWNTINRLWVTTLFVTWCNKTHNLSPELRIDCAVQKKIKRKVYCLKWIENCDNYIKRSCVIDYNIKMFQEICNLCWDKAYSVYNDNDDKSECNPVWWLHCMRCVPSYSAWSVVWEQ